MNRTDEQQRRTEYGNRKEEQSGTVIAKMRREDQKRRPEDRNRREE